MAYLKGENTNEVELDTLIALLSDMGVFASLHYHHDELVEMAYMSISQFLTNLSSVQARQVMPRPGVVFPLEAALLDTDRQLAGNGIATAYHALTLSWEPGLRSIAQAQAAQKISHEDAEDLRRTVNSAGALLRSQAAERLLDHVEEQGSVPLFLAADSTPDEDEGQAREREADGRAFAHAVQIVEDAAVILGIQHRDDGSGQLCEILGAAHRLQVAVALELVAQRHRVGDALLLAQLPARLAPVHVGQADIEQHKVDMCLALEGLERLGGRPGRRELELAVAFELLLERLHKKLVVLDQ